MTLRSTKYWELLPAEIRLMILELSTREKNPGWASYAAVCKEWQFYIEKKNFHRLKVRDSCLDEFKSMVVRQRDLVRHIQFIIELPEYSCYSCRSYTSVARESPEQSIIGDRIWELFSILGTWKPATGGITLELNVYSPSDSKHWFKNCYFTSDDGDLDTVTSTHDGDGGEISSKLHDPKHGWFKGQRDRAPSISATEELFQSVVDMGPRIEFPRVDVVACFMIRRQLRRCLRPLDVQYILGSFPQLERMVYERWQPWAGLWSTFADSQFLHLLNYGIPKTLRRLSVFEDFNKDLAAILADPYSRVYQEPDTVRKMSDYKRIDFVCRIFNLNLEEISVSYMVNAEDFFPASPTTRYRDPWPTGPWERLQSLALTSQLLRPTTSHQETNALLFRAGVSALQMPKLRTLALWNGTRGMAAANMESRVQPSSDRGVAIRGIDAALGGTPDREAANRRKRDQVPWRCYLPSRLAMPGG
ncbi:hypothetical protein V500_04688 [Pseudogymnoascus sp. VKM F-4518 (FW-2643)]|nr:hypothetical protein V500_04688 [Pseudogymnoascus sp. VKM F-4518 (FW-2643)]